SARAAVFRPCGSTTWSAAAPPRTSRRTSSYRRRSLPERKVCVLVASRANYARVKTVMEAVRAHPKLELQVVAGASLVLERFGNAVRGVELGGFPTHTA